MKSTNIIAMSMLGCAMFYSCNDDGPKIEDFPGEDVAFTYEVTGDYTEDFYLGSTIQFTNTSEVSGACSWDFGDGTTSTDPNPTHKYNVAKTYKVTLKVGDQGAVSRNLLISDIFPTVSVENAGGEEICEVGSTGIALSVYLPNPEQLPVEYEWVFPAGTETESGEMVSSYKGEDPGVLKFRNVGSQKLVLKTKMGGRTLEEGVVNVQVGYTSPVKTLYYAVKDGNIMALKLVNDAPEGMTVNAYDLGVKSGNHPMNILNDDSLLYVLDAGKQFTYVNDMDSNLGDGKVSAISMDGKIVESLISNSGKAAFDDPFYGYVDKTARLLYVADRNTGISAIPLDQRNLMMDRTKYPYFVQNNRLNYYKAGYDYGAMNACFTKSNNVWYWAKTYNGTGIFRFKDSDIKKAEVSTGVKGDPYDVLLSGLYIKSFAIDATRQRVYFMVRSTGSEGGLYATSTSVFETLTDLITLNNAVKAKSCVKVAALISDDLGSAGEYVDICQMVVDEEDGSLYFGYRASSVSTVPGGLYRCIYNADLSQTKLNLLKENVLVYGVTLRDKKTKLFY